MTEAGARERLLRDIVSDRPDLWQGELHGLRYKPERRYVAQLIGKDGVRAAVKVYTRHGYEAARRNAKVFQSWGPLRVARRLGRSNRDCVVVTDWLPGILLSEAMLDHRQDCQAVARAGAALAALHEQKPNGLVRRRRKDEAATLRAVADGLGAICPRLSARASRLAERLSSNLVKEPEAKISVHGDFYAKQVLVTSEGAAIVDLDRAGQGDPAADLGLFIAHLGRDALRGTLEAGRLEALKGALLDGYEVAHGGLPRHIDLYTAVGLLRLTPEPFRLHEPEWPERMEAILRRAEVAAGDQA